MKTEIGEYIVGAYLKIIEGCDVVSYNVRPPGGGHTSLGELDAIGFLFETGTVFVCEVTTHICGVLYKNYDTTIQKVTDKHRRQQEYAREHLRQFKDIRYQFWSPVVPSGLVCRLKAIGGLDIVVNEEYTRRVDCLRKKARELTEETNNPFFRTLQILERLRRSPATEAVVRPQADGVVQGDAALAKPDCLCCQKDIPTERPRQCPLCGLVLRGNGWDGIDAHWRARHGKDMKYEDFRSSLCDKHRA